MRKFALTHCILFTFVAALPAIAGPRTFVSGLGNDANPGTREQPKRTFASALAVVDPGGQIVALDSAGYASSTLVINKSVSIIVPPGVAGFITVSGAASGITINAAVTDVVSIRGLIIETSSAANGTGIHSSSVGTLTVEDCAIRKFNRGISFNQPNASHLQVHGGSVRHNTTGIYLQPAAAVTVDAIVTGCLLENNGTALHASAPGGFAVAMMRVSDCTITNNNNGVTISGPTSGVISRGNNTLENNGSGNSFPGTFSPK